MLGRQGFSNPTALSRTDADLQWIASATALYMAHALLVPAEEVGSMYHLLNYFVSFVINLQSSLDLISIKDFHIIPVPNPDGYEYTRTEDRLWYVVF